MTRAAGPLAALALGLAAAGCTIAPTPSAYRQRLIDAGVQKRVGPLVVQDEGQGPAVVMLHGLGGSAFDWRHQRAPVVEAGYRVIVPDLLGAGYSDHPADADYSIRAQTERVAALLDELKVERARFVGNSYGGGISLAMAVLHPERVESMVLLDAAAIPQDFPWYIGLARTPPFGEIFFAIVPKHFMTEIMLSFFCGRPEAISQEEVREYAREMSFTGAATTTLKMTRDLDLKDAEELLPRLASVRVPTLILWGGRDHVTPLESGKRLVSLIPGSELEVFPDCGHIPHMERPAEVTRRLLEFLRATPAGGR